MGTSVYTTVIPVTSSSGSEDVSSTTTGEPAPAPSDPFNEDPVLEKYFKPPSKAWIAGAVAEPLLALIAGGCFVFWLRRHKQRKRLVESGGSGPGINVNDLPCIQAEFVQPSSEVAKTFDTTPPSMCELEATEVVHQGPFQGTTTGTGGAMRL
ncbi:hypothetical protein B0T09DRAFT_30758 [Sordaria sp. MPI-SDFR-AT-0083]|nr:hypothetical protein B0T09DRAFT_30758 [Sordaria sp. MPI-SDFR-AT-0083]